MNGPPPEGVVGWRPNGGRWRRRGFWWSDWWIRVEGEFGVGLKMFLCRWMAEDGGSTVEKDGDGGRG